MRSRQAMAGASSGILASISRCARTRPVAMSKTDSRWTWLPSGRTAPRTVLPSAAAWPSSPGRIGPGPGGAALLALATGHRGHGAWRADGQAAQPAVHGRVEGLGVEPGEHARKGAGARRPDPLRPRVPPPAQHGQRVLGAAGRPLRGCGWRVMPARPCHGSPCPLPRALGASRSSSYAGTSGEVAQHRRGSDDGFNRRGAERSSCPVGRPGPPLRIRLGPIR